MTDPRMSDTAGTADIQALVARAASRDASAEQRLDAFGRVVQHYQQMVYGCAYAMLGDFHLAEDAAQETFLTAYQRLSDLREPKAFAGWLRRIARNHCLNYVRRKQAPPASLDSVPEPRSREPAPGQPPADTNDRVAVDALRVCRKASAWP